MHFIQLLYLIMDFHWRNISDETGIDNHFEIKVSNSEKPTIRLIAGANFQFKIINDSKNLLWGRIASDYYGCWALRSNNQLEIDEMPIPPITSKLIEKSKLVTAENRFEFWFKYFLKTLEKSKSSFLFDGDWEVTEAKIINVSITDKKWRTVDYNFNLNSQQPTWIDWDFGMALKVIRLKEQRRESGRIKWWRKKVIEGSCPPILTWFVSSLDSLVVIDGHDRLTAFELESLRP